MGESREINRAADRFVAAVEEFARQVERLRPQERMVEEEADRFGNEAVHETRDHLSKAGNSDRERGSLREDEVKAWIEAREERRRCEGYEPV